MKLRRFTQPLLGLGLLLCACSFAQAQDLDSFELPGLQTTCFGMLDITEPEALAICDALALDENVRARELAQQWIRAEPQSPAAQFALAEILIRVEGNLARAVFHLNRAEELTNYSSLGRALAAGNAQWHYLALSELSYVHQLMGNQLASLEYLDKIANIYGQDVESLRGWPLIKLQEWELARESANKVLRSSNNPRERSRAWNTLCAVELAQLRPAESLEACDKSLSEDEAAADGIQGTVYLLNAAEVALSMLRMQEAERFLDRAARVINPNSVGDPWINILNLYMSQGRFDDARFALDNMLVWRDSQEPIVSIMNQAEHFLAAANFLLLTGYAEDAITLSTNALNQPDRTGSYSADEEQKDSVAALTNAVAHQSAYELAMEQAALLPLRQKISSISKALAHRLRAWRSSRHAASLFADAQVLQNRLRPYAPLDVYIPEWIEPEIIAIMGPGVSAQILEQARTNGAFALNEGYYFSYKSEIAALSNKHSEVAELAELALAQLPEEEVLLKARIASRAADATWKLGQVEQSLAYYEMALQWDPSSIRRLGLALPINLSTSSDPDSIEIGKLLANSPRFKKDERGFEVQVSSTNTPQICLLSRRNIPLSCVHAIELNETIPLSAVQQIAQNFHTQTFGPGIEISPTLRMALRGNSAVVASQERLDAQAERASNLTR
ncbi:MAG: hypothetical protein R3332_11445 [Pseudohongiellaceae bacterium]|nr:hypothetical protein [Pseudohongiellaceae bacterium]